MRSRSSPAAVLSLALAAFAATGVRAAAPADEAAALGLFQLHQRDGVRPDAARDACLQFEQRHAASALRPVARCLLGWDLLRLKATNEAVRALEGAAGGAQGPMLDAAQDVARCWLSRVDRERVRTALKEHYTRHADFPASLDALRALPEAMRPPATDRWGRSWRYGITQFERIKGTKMQRYTLESPSIPPGGSDLAAALRKPYGFAMEAKPVRIESAGGTVVFLVGGRTEMLSVGAKQGRAVLAWAGATVAVLSDGEYWNVTAPAPGGGG